MLDGAALASDAAAVVFVWTMAAIGAVGTSVEGTPVVGPAGAYAGWWMGQIAVRPMIIAGNWLATFATAATAVSEAKTGANRVQAEVSLSVQSGVQAEMHATMGPGTQVASVLTGLGWLAPLAEPSIVLQAAAIAADLGWYSTSWGSLGIRIQFP